MSSPQNTKQKPKKQNVDQSQKLSKPASQKDSRLKQNYEDNVALVLEVEMWKKKYLELYSHKGSNEQEQKAQLMNERLQMLHEENKNLYVQLKEKLTENEKHWVSIQKHEVEVQQLNHYKLDVQKLHELLQFQMSEVGSFRIRYCDLEEKFLKYKIMEINLNDYEGKMKGFKNEMEHWREKYRNLLDEQGRSPQNYGQGVKEVSEKGVSQQFTLQLSNHLQSKMTELDDWRKRALSLELQVQDLKAKVQWEAHKNDILEEEIKRLNQSVSQVTSKYNDSLLSNQELRYSLKDMELMKNKLEKVNQILLMKENQIIKKNENIYQLDKQVMQLNELKVFVGELKNQVAQLEQEAQSDKNSMANTEYLLKREQEDTKKLSYENSKLTQQCLQFLQLKSQNSHLQTLQDMLESKLNDSEAKNSKLLIQIHKHRENEQDARAVEQQLKKQELLFHEFHNSLDDNKNKIVELNKLSLQLQVAEETTQELMKENAILEMHLKDTSELYQMLQASNLDLEQRMDIFLVREQQHYLTERDLGRCMQLKTALDENLANQYHRSNEIQQHFTGVLKMCNNLEQMLIYKTQELANSDDAVGRLRRELADQSSKFTNSESLLTKLREDHKSLEHHSNNQRTQNQRLTMQIKNKEQHEEQLSKDGLQLVNTINQLQRNQHQELQSTNLQMMAQSQKCFQEQKLQQDFKQKCYLQDQELTHLASEFEKAKHELKIAHSVDLINQEQCLENGELKMKISALENELKHLREQSLALTQQQLVNALQREQLVDAFAKYEGVRVAHASCDQKLKSQMFQITRLESGSVDQAKELAKTLNKAQQYLEEVQGLTDQLQKLQSSLNELRGVSVREVVLLNANDQLTNELDEVKYALVKCEGEKRVNDLQIAQLNALTADYKLQKNQNVIYQGEFEKQKNEITSLTKKLNTSDDELVLSQQNNQILQDQQNEIKQNLEEMIHQLNQLEVQLREAMDKIKSLELQLSTQSQELLTIPQLKQNIKLQANANTQLESRVESLVEQVDLLKLDLERKEKLLNFNSALAKESGNLRNIINEDQLAIQHAKGEIAGIAEDRDQSQDRHNAEVDRLHDELNIIRSRCQIIPDLQDALVLANASIEQLVFNKEQLKEDNDKLQHKIEALQQQLAGFVVLQDERNQLRRDNVIAIQKTEALEQSLEEAEYQISKFADYRESLESRIALLASEIERLQNMLRKKNTEIEDLKENLINAEEEIKDLQPLDPENARLSTQLDSMEQNINELQSQVRQVEMERDEAQDKIRDLEGKCALMSSEIERQNKKNANKIKQIEDLQLQVTDLEDLRVDFEKRVQQIEELQIQIESISVEMQELGDNYNKNLNELANQKQLNHDMEVKLAKLDSLRVQLSEAQQTIVAKDREIENYKTEFLTLHEKIDELEQIKFNYEGKLAMLSSEIQRLNMKCDKSKQQIEGLEDQIDDINRECDRIASSYQKIEDSNTNTIEESRVKSYNRA